ncbi:MAG: hypothetical protein H6612_02305 [Ignavibacteriales bacterium]|nr:hypothetical protein [Ignavibacteriales bacterium]MCB9258158.1 hypothetical protein [Ignavibacteriales bacterium]
MLKKIFSSFFVFVMILTTSSLIAQAEQNKLSLNNNFDFQKDTSLTAIVNEQKYSTTNFMLQGLAGYGFGFGLASLTYNSVLKNSYSHNDGKRNLMISSLLLYVFGSAGGVSLVASIENKNISFLKTLGYSALGGGIGLFLYAALWEQNSSNELGFTMILALPTIFSMLYSNYICDWPINSDENIIPKIYSQKDVLDYSKTFNVEIINFIF